MTAKLARLVDLSRAPGSMAIGPDGRSAWVFGDHPGQSSVTSIDVLTGARHEDLRFHDGDRPGAAAFSSDGTRAFVAIDRDHPSAFSSGTIAFVSSSGREFGRITVGDQTEGVQIRHQVSALAIGPGANGDVLFAADHASGVVWALDASTGAVLSEIEVGGGPTSIMTHPARQRRGARRGAAHRDGGPVRPGVAAGLPPRDRH